MSDWIDEALDDLKPPETFTVTLPVVRTADPENKVKQLGGQILRFRNFKNADEWEDWQEQSLKWARDVMATVNPQADPKYKPKTQFPEEYRAVLPSRGNVAIMAHMAAFLSVDPQNEDEMPKMSTFQVCKLFQNTNGYLAIKLALSSNTTNFAHLGEQVAEAKNA